MLYRTQNPHGGDVYGAEVAFDFSSNVNPLARLQTFLPPFPTQLCTCGSIPTPIAVR